MKPEQEEKEEWRPLFERPNYEVSSLGRIRSLDIKRTIRRKGQKSYDTTFIGKVLVQSMNPGGYYAVTFGKRFKPIRVSRAVAMAFIPNPQNKETVNHKDGNKANNRVDNLEWATFAENTIHSRRVLGRCTGESHGRSKLTENDVIDIRLVSAFGATQTALSKAFGVSQVLVGLIVNRAIWKHVA